MAELTDEQIDALIASMERRLGGWAASASGSRSEAIKLMRSDIRALLATQGAEPVAWCDPSNPLNNEAFAWPGTLRPATHTCALYTAPPPTAEVTEAMVTAYLEANDQYWRETDSLPQRNPSKWRNGTAREATRVSLIAAIAASPTPPTGTEKKKDAEPVVHQGMTIAGDGAAMLGRLMREQRASRLGVYPDGNPNAGTEKP